MAITEEEKKARKKLYAARWRAKVKANPFLLERKREQDRLLKQKMRAESPGAHAEYQREWYRKNPDKIRGYSAKQYVRIMSDPKLRERVNARHRMANMPREDALSERDRKREVMRSIRKTMREDGVIEVRHTRRSRERYLLDYRCYRAVRELLLLGHMGRQKNYGYLPYSSLELVGHIGPLLGAGGFEWSGYGDVWNVDHIRPLADFIYKTENDEAFKECWSLANLRPMLVTHNRSKGLRRDGDWSFVE